MKGKTKKKLRSVFSAALVVAMVCSVIPYWPTGIFMINAKAETLNSDVMSLLKGWTVTNDADLTASVSKDEDGTQVLTLDQTAGGSMAANSGTDFSTASVLTYTKDGVTFGEGYKISADVTVLSAKQSNSCGIGIGDSVKADSVNSYAYAAFRGGVNVRCAYRKADGTYGSTAMQAPATGEILTEKLNTKYAFSYTKKAAGYDVSVNDGKALFTKSINSANVHAALFSTASIAASVPTIVIEGAKVEIRNLKVTDSTGEVVYDMQNILNSYITDYTVEIGDANVASFNVNDAYVSAPLSKTITTELLAPLADGAALTVKAGTADTAVSALGAYSAVVDAVNNKIIVKAGTTVVGELAYTYAGALKTLIVGAPAVTYDFRTDILGVTTVPEQGQTSGDGVMTIKGRTSYNGTQHGANVYTGDVISINIPKGKTTLTFGVCAYGSASANVEVSGASVGDRIALEGDGTNDKRTTTFVYTSDKAATLDIVLTGNGYLHYITAVAEEVKPAAVITGTVQNADGQTLEFFNGDTKVAEAVITAGSYCAELETGAVYEVKFADFNKYTVTAGNTVDLTKAAAGDTITNNIIYSVWDSAKAFSMTIGGTEFTVTPGEDATKDYIVTTADSSMVESVTSTQALVWADLNGGGRGILKESDITNVSDNVNVAVNGNIITVTYKDAASKPYSYKLGVKDNSAAGIPTQNGTPITYTFTQSALITDLSNIHAKGSNYAIKTPVNSMDKLVTFASAGNGIYLNDTSHGMGISSNSTISVKTAGNAVIDLALCQWGGGTVTAKVVSGSGTVTPAEAQSCKAAACGDKVSFSYEGDAAVVELTFAGGTAYLHSMTVTNEAPAAVEHPQPAMPKIFDFGTASNLTVTPVGQRLVLKQENGILNTVDGKVNSLVSYYGFDPTADNVTLSADIVLNTGAASNYSGVFFGAYDGENIATVGIRNLTGLRGIYSKSDADMAGAGGVNTAIEAKTVVSFTASKTADGFIIKAAPKNGETQTMQIKYNSSSYRLFANGENTSVSYGFILSNATATITNMKYTAADGSVLYDQNACYDAAGTAPVVEKVTATSAATRDYITVDWTSSVLPDGDGRYILQVSKDNSDWTTIEENLTESSFKYAISDGGNYKFRVAGRLGINGQAGTYAESNIEYVKAALTSPELNASASAASILVSWNAVAGADSYEVYRYLGEENKENPELLAATTAVTYIDTTVTTENPYFYYVVAKSADNWSNPSKTVWAVATSGHKGQYAYEDESAGITITKRSYDTVYNGKITLEGIVEKAGNVTLQVNGVSAAQTAVTERGAFSFKDIALVEGRNDVNLLVTDANGNVTRKTFNFVYLTAYDLVVDASFTGADGTKNADGVITYKTVQAALDSVPAGNTERVIILVKEGNYEEHLTINTPNITLIGEDSEKTRIYFDTDTIGMVGGDMAQRCAIYVKSGATGFLAENLTFENTYAYRGDGSRSNESADALRNDANDASYVNVRILGYQDTLCANAGTQYYFKCYIAGNVDFIYGNEPRAFFNDCQLVFRYNANKNSGYVCAPKTSLSAAYGLTFYDCQITAESGCTGSKYLLARPWGADAYIAWINCYMGKILKGTMNNPYADMSGNLATEARFYEYGSYGPAYTINANRRQLSTAMAEKMITADYLGWDNKAALDGVNSNYIGTQSTTAQDRYVNYTYSTDSALPSEGNDTGLSQFVLEGYANSAGVTGGGTLLETSSNYYKTSTAEQFLSALIKARETGMPSVIELTADIGLGTKEISSFDSYSKVIKAHGHQPLTHPALLQTGVSQLKIDGMENLTIYSKNGAKITHTTVDIANSSNIMIRNIVFDEIWEWDEDTSGAYDTNDWDYMTIEKGSSGIWIDHCTFYKAYDGVIDVKTPVNKSDITISWCAFMPGSDGDVFFNAMMDELNKNPSAYPYYSSLLASGMTKEQIDGYAYGQKKTHLLGQSDDDTSAANITLTLANNYYKNSMDRMPRLRYGTAHVYNCIMDAQDLRELRDSITNEEEAKKIVSNGASSTCGASMLLENCNISGITNALNSGNGDSPAGYINAINSAYYLDGAAAKLEVRNNNTIEGDEALITDADAFIKALPYSGYKLYDANSLGVNVEPFAGAKKVTMTTLQWEKTTYTAGITGGDEGGGDTPGGDSSDTIINVEKPENVPDMEITMPKEEIKDAINLTDEEKAAILAGTDLEISMKLADISTNVSESEKALIKGALADAKLENAVAAKYI
ncbi:MAG: pectinesterase family protein, partial [Eubacteriales bacterium]|nr:pectinesterase family protein [Eubacteriales bacterium]